MSNHDTQVPTSERPAASPAGIRRLHGLYYYVHNLERSRRLFVDQLDFREVAGGEDDEGYYAVFEAERARYFFIEPKEGIVNEASHFLQRHPEGIGRLAFEVKDLETALSNLEARGATPIHGIQSVTTPDGTLRYFDITTPFGETTWRFLTRDGDILDPTIKRYETPQGGQNRFGFKVIDHITSNFRTMSPALLWMEHVMGFEQYWDVQFHTSDLAPDATSGSGLKSVVMRDPHSGLKFANNEPKRPFFTASQIQLFVNDLRCDGVQHTALALSDGIVPTIHELQKRGVPFLNTPDSYYELLPNRLKSIGVDEIDEDIDELHPLGILVDGRAHKKYLLQIFLQEAAAIHEDKSAGPFFLEIIQRKGDPGFGEGNFRALFESIERQQVNEGRIS